MAGAGGWPRLPSGGCPIQAGFAKLNDPFVAISFQYDEVVLTGKGGGALLGFVAARPEPPYDSGARSRDEKSVPGCGCTARSEERRVGKECRSRWSPYLSEK